MKKFLSYSLTSFVCMLFAFSALHAQKAAKTDSSSAAAGNALLYKISGKNLTKPSYLFGTIHIICPNDMFPMEKLSTYLDQTDRLVMELDMDNPAEMQSMAKGLQMSDGKTIKDFLTAEEFAKVDEMFKNYLGISAENVKQMKPFFLTIMVTTSPKALGCAPPGSYEMSFLKAAMEKKKEIEGLESVASQYAVFEKTPLEKQVRALYELAQNPQKSVDDFKKLIEAYKSQNSDNLYVLMDAQMKNQKDSQDMQGALLDDRNKDWIPKIEKTIAEKSSFIAVGGGHLGGKNGVINLLKAKGYKVEAIKL